MGKAEKLKREHIKKVNNLLDEGFKNQDPKERPIILKELDWLLEINTDPVNLWVLKLAVKPNVLLPLKLTTILSKKVNPSILRFSQNISPLALILFEAVIFPIIESPVLG